MSKNTKKILREEPQADGTIERMFMDGRREIFFSSLEQELQFTNKKFENLLRELQKNPNDPYMKGYIEAYLLKVRELFPFFFHCEVNR